MKTIRNSFRIFRRDCRRIARSPLAILVLIGASILPCLYAWVNIGAYEDPYQYTGGLKVAVASNDRGVSSEFTGELNAGEKVLDSLKDNHSFGWTFVDEKKAVKGVRSGEYYAAIIIPESFSEDLLSITTGELKQPVLEYYLNEKKNAMAPLLMNVGANTLKNQVNQQFVDAAVQAVSDIAQSMMDDLGLKMDSVHQSVSADLNAVSDNLSQYDTMVGQLREILAEYPETDQNMRTTLDGVVAAADSGQETLDQAERTLQEGRDSYLNFSDGLNRNLEEGSALLSDIRRSSDVDFYDLNAKVQSVNQKTTLAVSLLQQITDWNADILQNLRTLSDPLPTTSEMIQRLQEENQGHSEVLQALQSGNQAIGNAASETLNNAARIQNHINNSQTSVSDVQNAWTRDVQQPMAEKLDRLSWFLGWAEGILDPVDSQVVQMNAILDGLGQSMDSVNTSLEQTQSMLTNLREQIDNSVTDLNLLTSSEQYQKLLNSSIDGQKLSGFISSPVSLKNKTFFSVRNYGTAMSPFFTNLAIWVGGIVLLSLFKLEVDTDEKIRKYRPSEGYLGRGMLFMLAGQMQAVIVCLGDLLIMKIQCVHPFLFILSGMVISLVYINFIYALAITLKHVGKALCVVILIFQVPSSSGTYPVEMTSSFFRFLNPILPFTYGVRAMREAEIGIYGNHYILSLLKLSVFLLIALILGLTMRSVFINLNILFDKKLSETDLMICEETTAPEQERFRLFAAIRLLAGRERFLQTTEASIRRFETVYQKRIRQSFQIVLIVLPLLFMTLMFTVGGSRMLFLVLWISSLVALMVFQILIEYFREHLDRQRRMAEMSDQELLQLLNRQKEPEEEEAAHE